MLEYLQVLGLDYGASKEEIKKAYFNKMKEFPPELYEEEFMEITNAYEALTKEIKEESNQNIIDNSQVSINQVFSNIIETIEGEEEFYILISQLSELCKIINTDNFTYINELSLNVITLLMKENYIAESLLITVVLGKSFKNIGLEKLCKSYEELERVLIFNKI